MNDPIVILSADAAETAVPRPSHTSFSALDGYRTCPARWAAGRVLDVPYRRGDARVTGRLVHSMLEHTVGADGHVPADEGRWRRTAAQVLDGDERRPPRERLIPAEPAVPVDEWVDLAVGKLKGFHPALSFDPLAAEREFNCRAWGIPVRGFIDYMDRSGVVLDWKTGKVPPADSTSHGDQLRLYRAALQDMGGDADRLGDVYVEHDRIVWADVSPEAMERTGVEMNRLWDGLQADCERGAFDYRPGFLCGWCPLARACPAASLNRWNRKGLDGALAPDDPRLGVPDDGFTPAVEPPHDWAEAEADAFGQSDETRLRLLKQTEVKSDETRLQPPAGTKTQSDGWPEPEGGHERSQERKEPMMKLTAIGESRPYEPTIDGKGRLNVAGYAVGGLTATIRRAQALCAAAGHVEWTPAVHRALVRAQMRVAHDVWGEYLPKPADDNHTVAAILDFSATRDIRTILFDLLDHDPTKPADLDAMLKRIEANAAVARTMAGEVRRNLMEGLG